MGDDSHTHAREVQVSARMISVKMGVYQKTDLARIQRFDCPVDLIRQWRELVVDHERSVLASQHTNVTAGALQHVNILSDFYRSYFDRVEILGLGRNC